MEVEKFADLGVRVMARPARLGPVRLVAVDGPAGSGKTTFAARLAHALRSAGADVAEIHTDDLLEGWADIETYWPRLEEQILRPFAAGRPARYRPYDWVRGRFDDAWHDVPVPDVLVLEGVTSARTAGEPLRSLAVLVHADPDLRLARGIERDGESLREHWLRWMADEDRHFADEATAARVDLLVDGAPTLPHDPETEYVRL
jgi:uridine kinase